MTSALTPRTQPAVSAARAAAVSATPFSFTSAIRTLQPSRSEARRDGLAQTLRAAGDDGDLVFQISAHVAGNCFSESFFGLLVPVAVRKGSRAGEFGQRG